MGTNGKEISCEHFPKNPEKNEIAKQAIETKMPLRRKFNFRTIISDKKFPKIWIHLTRLFLGFFSSTQISEFFETET